MEQFFPRARRLRRWGALCALVAAAFLGLAIVLNENAVNYEDRVVDDGAAYVALALALAVIGAALAWRAAADPGRRGVTASVVVVVIAAVVAVGAGLLIGTAPIFMNVQVCLAHQDVWLAVYSKPTPGSCPPYTIPDADLPLFYPGMFAALAAGALLSAGVVVLYAGRKRWQLVGTAPASFSPARSRSYRLAASACAAVAALASLLEIILKGLSWVQFYPGAVLILLAIAAAIGLRSAARPEARGVAAPITLASLALGCEALNMLSGGWANVMDSLVWLSAGALSVACVVLMAAGRGPAVSARSASPGPTR